MKSSSLIYTGVSMLAWIQFQQLDAWFSFAGKVISVIAGILAIIKVIHGWYKEFKGVKSNQ